MSKYVVDHILTIRFRRILYRIYWFFFNKDSQLMSRNVVLFIQKLCSNISEFLTGKYYCSIIMKLDFSYFVLSIIP